MPDPHSPLRVSQSETRTHPIAGRSNEGHALSLVLWVAALVAVAGLGWGLAEVLGLAGGTKADEADAPPRAAGSDAVARSSSASQKVRADAAALDTGTRPASLGVVDGGFGPLEALGSGLEVDDEAEGEEEGGLGGRTEFSKTVARVELGGGASKRRGSPFLTGSGDPASRSGSDEEEERVPFAPGYATILGVRPLTPGYEANLRRGWEILEYNGTSIQGSLDLRNQWQRSDLPEAVSLTARDPATGDTFELEVPSGPLGLMLAPAYERP